MPSISKLSEKCKKCSNVNICNRKMMEACTYIADSTLMQPSIATSANGISQPLLVPHDYRNIKVGENTTVTIDLEVLKENLKNEHLQNLMFGA